ncbi:MAG: phenylacetate-CoA ligase, partial [Thermodesulfobacteriota bacterium]|nr:phenylacetate-CoA ligase [Thermodesulfobacteriota bacterium]
MKRDSPYWNPFLERLPRENLEQLQLKKFRRIFQWAYENSRFHRSLYESAGIGLKDIRTLDDVRRVPKVEKSMMLSVQGKDP